ncbi:MAG TPA: flagellar protein FlgN, partial [Gammaproteobacteria bacterium]|nr:flagellar protein FlgN [Gammaproteobacteria bacterium]
NEQIRCARTMLSTLSEENQALIDGDAERLNAASAGKARLVETLEALEAERRDLTAAIKITLTSVEAGSCEPQWRSLLELIAACKQQNQRNGALVKARTEQVRTALKLLRGSESEFYDPSGLTPSSRSARSLGSA